MWVFDNRTVLALWQTAAGSAQVLDSEDARAWIKVRLFVEYNNERVDHDLASPINNSTRPSIDELKD